MPGGLFMAAGAQSEKVDVEIPLGGIVGDGQDHSDSGKPGAPPAALQWGGQSGIIGYMWGRVPPTGSENEEDTDDAV